MTDVDAPHAVSVVLPTRRRPQLLARALAALLAQDTTVPYEVVVVNDDAEPLEDLPADPRLLVVEGPGRGVAAARNRGIAYASAPIVAFTDDDTVPPPSWITQIAAAAAAHPDAVGFDGPVEVGPIDVLYEHAPIARPGGGCGANVAYRRWVLDTLEGFDERFSGWMPEDVDFAERARAHGPLVHVPTMEMVHPPRPESYRERIGKAAVVEGEWLLFRKHPGLSAWRVPLRWGPAVLRFRSWFGYLADPAVVRRSPARAARIVALGGGTGLVALWACWRRWPGPG